MQLKTIGPYKILQKLGQGGMGEVVLALDTRLERHVALKFLSAHITGDSDELGRFKIEAKAAAALNHPNIATLYTIEELEGRPFIVMEYVEGKNLREMQQEGEELLPVEQVIDIGLQIASGLQAAHQKGIVHRDIKSANILLTPAGQVKVADFGIAKIDNTPQLTRENTTLGTLDYMSPDQLAGQQADPRSDLWALGVVLYELLTGTMPFSGEYPQAVMYSILNEPPRPVESIRDDVPPHLWRVIEKCLQKDPEQRYQEAGEIVRDLQNPNEPDTGPDTVAPEQKDTVVTPPADDAPQRSPGARFPVRNTLFILSAALVLIVIVPFLPQIREWFGGVPAEKHIAVLPFINVSGESLNQVFCDGLVETMTSQLTRMEQSLGTLWVVPASEVRGAQIATASEARKQFGVNLAINGSIQRSGGQIRLTLNLVDTEKVRQVNSLVITEEVGNLTVLQDQIVQKLAELLEVDLSPETQDALMAGTTRAPGAYEYYLQGRGYLQNYNIPEDVNAAIEVFQQALAVDSLYALAHAGLGEAYLRKHQLSGESQWIPRAVQRCEKALSLSSQLAPAYVTLGILYRFTGEYRKAEESLQQALKLDPTQPQAYLELANTYSQTGEMSAVEQTYQKAIALKPNYWANYYRLGLFYFRRGEYTQAAEQFTIAGRLAPQNYVIFRDLGAAYFLLEQYAKAIEYFEHSLKIQPNYGAYANLGTLFYGEGEYSKAAQMYENALELKDRDHLIWGNLGLCYQQIPEKKEKAAAIFRKALELTRQKQRVNPNNSFVLADAAIYHAALKDAESARKSITRALEFAPNDVNLMFQAAEVFVQIGDKTTALSYLEKAVKGGYSRKRIGQSVELKKLQDDPRYRELMEEAAGN